MMDILADRLLLLFACLHLDFLLLFQVQVKLFSSLATLLPQWQVDGDEKGRGVDLRRDIGVPLIVDILQQFYYLDPSPIFNPDTAGKFAKPLSEYISYLSSVLSSFLLMLCVPV